MRAYARLNVIGGINGWAHSVYFAGSNPSATFDCYIGLWDGASNYKYLARVQGTTSQGVSGNIGVASGGGGVYLGLQTEGTDIRVRISTALSGNNVQTGSASATYTETIFTDNTLAGVSAWTNCYLIISTSTGTPSSGTNKCKAILTGLEITTFWLGSKGTQ